jgi:thiol-disulfide isomerase/thioredoxin
MSQILPNIIFMKNSTLRTLVILFIVFAGCSSSKENILLKTNIQLQKLTSVSYKTEYKNYNPFTGKLEEQYSAEMFFDFASEDSIIGAKYYFDSDKSNYGFDGSNTFYTQKEKKKVIYRPVSLDKQLIGIQYLHFSIQDLRNKIPQFLNDDNIVINQLKDTIINNSKCFQFDIFKENSSSSYRLFIDEINYYPTLFIQYSNHETLWEVSYKDIEVLSQIPDSIFKYWQQNSDYLLYSTEEHQIVVENEKKIKNNSFNGVKAKDWTLPSMFGDSVTLSKIESHLILLEFWFPYCTGCVRAIPDINEIQKSYKSQGLNVYGIEFTKSDTTGLANYISKWKIEIPTLFAGKKIAMDYGILAGPTFFLVNKEGEFVYKSEGFVKSELIKAIEENL